MFNKKLNWTKEFMDATNDTPAGCKLYFLFCAIMHNGSSSG